MPNGYQASVLRKAWLYGVVDVVAVLAAARIASVGIGVHDSGFWQFWNEGERWAFSFALLAPFVLDAVDCRRRGRIQRKSAWRFLAGSGLGFAGVAIIFMAVSGEYEHLPPHWCVIWLLISSVLIGLLRGVWDILKVARTHSVAIVGAGYSADLLMRRLAVEHAAEFNVLGIFDDRATRLQQDATLPTGTLDDLVKLGAKRPVDWVFITLPGSAEARVNAILRQLDPLNASVGLSPEGLVLRLPAPKVDFLGGQLPVTVLADGSSRRFYFDNYNLEQFAQTAAHWNPQVFGFVVTPNADHLIRLDEDAEFRGLYADADFVLLDSRLISRLLRFRSINLPVCTGSDLTEYLLGKVVNPGDAIVLIGGSEDQAQKLRQRYGLAALVHHNPPMGFINDPAAVENCLAFVEQHSPFRYCFLAVGSPQQERVARLLKQRGVAQGLTLCIGASIDFLTGAEQRAPKWVQTLSMEWAYRLLQNPQRMARRYLVRGPKVFGLLPKAQFILRPAAENTDH